MAMRAGRAIARRQRRARLARRLVIPLLAGALYLGHIGAWVAIAGFGLLLWMLVVIMLAEQQKCPRCETSLTKRRWWREDFAPTCPECGLPID